MAIIQECGVNSCAHSNNRMANYNTNEVYW